MLDVEKLVALRAVAAHGSIAAAARELGYTRSAVSQQVSALERAAGTPLLVRSGNAVVVTPIGRRLLDNTERILVELRAAEASLAQHGGEVAGRLRVGVPFREGPGVMISALTGARQQYPRLQITLAATSEKTAADEVKQGRLDMVILSQFGSTPAPSEPGLRQWVLGHDALKLCVPDTHALADKSSCEVEELRDEAWVMSPSSAIGRITMGLCATAGFQPQVAATVDDVATALGLVSAGWGITIAPDLTPLRQEAEIRRIRLERLEVFRHMVLLIRDGEQDSPEIASVVGAVLATSAKIAFLE